MIGKTITKPVLVADQEIYREDFSIKFSKYVIKNIHKNFLEKGFIEGNDIIESWIIEDENDKSYAMGFDYPIGTWMVTVKDNPNAVAGFSVSDVIGTLI